MPKIISTIFLIALAVALICLSVFKIGDMHPYKKFININESGDFNFISKKTSDGLDVYTLYTERDNKIEEKDFIVYGNVSSRNGHVFEFKENGWKDLKSYANNYSMKELVTFEVIKNAPKNSYAFDFNKNGWKNYDKSYQNKITIYLNKDTEINVIN